MRNRFALAAVLGIVGASLVLGGTSRADESCDPPKAPPKVKPAQPRPATLTPDRKAVGLVVGQTDTVKIGMTRPASPTPVDIYFVIDVSLSMDEAICGVQEDVTSIARGLALAKIDSNFGVGSFRDFPISHPGSQPLDQPSYPYGSKGDWAYRRDRDIGPLNRDLLETVHALKAGGGGDTPESTLEALFQAATGEGIDVPPAGPSEPDIDNGLQANFRKNTLRLFVTITDQWFRYSPDKKLCPPDDDPQGDCSARDDYPLRDYGEVVRALRENHILQAGIAITNSGGDSMGKLARATGAIAPPGGIDCNGDGKVDLPARAPLVCDADADTGSGNAVKMGPAIVSFVKALRDFDTVTYTVSGATQLLQSYSPHSISGVDLKHDAFKTLSLTVHCDRPVGRKTLNVSAATRGKTFATTTFDVVCDPKPPVLLSLGRAVAAPPPAPQPAPQINGAPNPHAVTAAATAPQAQQQLAYETVNTNEAPTRLEATLSRRRNTAGAAAAMFGGACMAACVAAVALRHRFVNGGTR